MGIYWKYENGYGNMGNLPKQDLHEYNMLVPTVNPSGLQSPLGSSLCWSVAWIKVL